MPRQISEQRMRGNHAHKEMIDPQLEHAGWFMRDHSKVKIEISMIVPPLSLQEEFAGMVARACPERSRRIEGLRGRMSEAGRQVNGLFKSLLSQSFGGGK